MKHPTVEAGIREFLHDTDTNVKQDITKFPLILPVYLQKTSAKPFIGYDTQLKLSDTVYELFVVMVHSGNHWMTLAKGPSGKWNLFNDSQIVEINDLNSLIQRDAMMLLYKKKVDC